MALRELQALGQLETHPSSSPHPQVHSQVGSGVCTRLSEPQPSALRTQEAGSCLAYLLGPHCGHTGGPSPSTPKPVAKLVFRAACTDLKFQAESKPFQSLGKNLVIYFFFQIVWAWQVPCCTLPSSPPSYNLKKKKAQIQNHCAFRGRRGLQAADSATRIRASAPCPHSLTQPPPEFCKFSFYILFHCTI